MFNMYTNVTALEHYINLYGDILEVENVVHYQKKKKKFIRIL